MSSKNQISLINSFKTFDYQFFSTLILVSLIPLVYTTIRIYFLGDLPQDWGFNIASQLAWVNIGYEVIQEALILPLFYVIGKSLSDTKVLDNKIKTGLITSFVVYLIASILLFVFCRPLLVFMEQKADLIDQTVSYIRLEAVAIAISILYRYIFLVLIILKDNKAVYQLLIVQTVLTVFCDSLLISQLPFSLQIGVNGIAITNIVVNITLFIFGLYILQSKNVVTLELNNLSFHWQREWLSIGSYSGIESLVRNTAFTLMILRLINIVNEQGSFWVATSFIWGWLLLPVLALGELIKRNTGASPQETKRLLPTYFLITGVISVIWLLTIPWWETFLQQVMNINPPDVVFNIALISIGFYIVFAFNNVVDSVFYGLGRTDLMLVQSVLVNTLFYGGMFIAYLTGLFVPTLYGITIMFGVGIAIDAVITFAIFIWLSSKGAIMK